MRFPHSIAGEARHLPREVLHLMFFSILFLMFVAIAPSISWSSGNCYAKQAKLDGPLLPVVA